MSTAPREFSGGFFQIKVLYFFGIVIQYTKVCDALRMMIIRRYNHGREQAVY